MPVKWQDAMSVHETDIAIKLDSIREELRYLADAAEYSSMVGEEFANKILEIISGLSQIAYEFASR